MAKIFDIDFRTGSLQEKVSGNFATPVNGFNLTQSFMGLAMGDQKLSPNYKYLDYLNTVSDFDKILTFEVAWSGNKTRTGGGTGSLVNMVKDSNNYFYINTFLNDMYLFFNYNGITILNWVNAHFPISNHKHFVLIFNTNTHLFKSYVNGIFFHTGTLNSTNVPDLTLLHSTVRIGAISNSSMPYRDHLYYVKMYNHALTQSEINKQYAKFINSKPLSKPKTKFYPYPNLEFGSISFLEDFKYEPADGMTIKPKDWIKGTGTFKISELVSDDLILNHLKKGTKMLECKTAGTIVFPSKKAYGTWEFILGKTQEDSGIKLYFINDKKDITLNNGYIIYINGLEQIDFGIYSSGSFTSLFLSNQSYLENNKFYKIKITRTLLGVFTLYIKGGAFGNNYQQMIALSGSNPITNTNHTTSNFTVVQGSYAGDKIGNIKYSEDIET